MTALGDFAEGFASWRRILGTVPPEAQLKVFGNAVEEVAGFIAHGLDRAAAADELVDMATSIGFEDPDLVQEVIARAFSRIDGEAESGIKWDELDEKREGGAKHEGNGKASPSGERLIRSSAEFVANFVPPEYVIDGILQRRFIYSLTGVTSAGKTAIMLLFAAIVALERMLGERGVERGRVLYFAGENPDDARMRWIAMSQQMDFDHDSIDVHFIPGRFKISEMTERIRTEIAAIGDVTLIIVDTSAAYFEGENENDNREQGQHAARLRSLTTMPGGPCVLVACHPPKNAGDDNLQPRGGGAFIAEIDGNLTARKSDAIVELHWQGKFRGPDFAPVSFQLRTVTHERLKDSKGRPIWTVVASHLSEAGQREIEKAARSHEDQLLAVLAEPHNGNASHADLAKLLGWHMNDGSPYRKRVSRTLEVLKKAKLITIARDGVELTAAGRKSVEGSKL